ncbi:MAG TPA: hypothetical protein VG713_20980, partial [Pirellulales bacterium]|nr:hypothetical protein [Pirellulales bacterium]
MPAGAELLGVWVDNEPRELNEGALSLPSAEFVDVLIAIATVEPSLQTSAVRAMPEIDLGLPVIERRWVCRVPPGYQCVRSRRLSRLPWTTRLFGALARSPSDAPFDPWSTDDWRALVSSGPDRSDATQRIQQWFRDLGDRLGTTANRRAATWGDFTERAEAAASNAGFVFRIDRPSLLDAGIDPRAVLPDFAAPAEDTSPAAAVDSLLWQAGLTLLSDGQSLVLTTSSTAELERRHLTPLGAGPAYWLEPSHLRDRIAAAAQPSARYVRAVEWRQSAPAVHRRRSPMDSQLVDLTGWPVDSTVVETTPATLQVVPRDRTDAWQWSALLGGASLSMLVCRWRRGAVVGVAVGAIVIALLIPDEWSAIAASALVGTLLGSVAWLWPAAPTQPQRTAAEPHFERAAVPTGLVVVAALGLGGSVALAAPNQPETAAPAQTQAMPRPTPTPAKVFPVFIPSDADGKPTGGRYSVPEEFYSALRKRSGEADAQTLAWTIDRVDYSATLVHDLAEMSLEVGELKATIDLTIDEADTTVHLPVGRDGVGQNVIRALVDGQPIETAWDETSQTLAWLAPSRGPTRLELFLVPTLRYFADGTGFDFAAPTMPTSQFEVSLPAQPPQIATPSALGQAQWSDDREQMTVQLGDARRLALRWRDARTAAAATPSVEVEELLWLKVRPGSVVLDTKLSLNIPPGVTLREVPLLVDSRLRALQSADATATLGDPQPNAEAAESGVQRRNLVFARPATDPTAVTLSTMLTDFGGVGQFRLPRLETQGLRVTRRWLAITVDPTLEADVHAPSKQVGVPAATFAAHWAADAAAPTLAYELSGREPAWRIDTRPKRGMSTAHQAMTISASASRLNFEYEAQIKTDVGHVFQH